MKKLILLLSVIILFVNFKAFADDGFTVSASVQKSIVFNSKIDKVSSYMKDLNIYKRNFPGIVSVNKLGGIESQWTYEVDAPLSSPMRMSFILVEKSATDYDVVFESKNPIPDYFKCSASLKEIADNKTKMVISIKISMTRESGSDVHFLAPILGEKFISKEMKKQITENLGIFLENCNREI